MALAGIVLLWLTGLWMLLGAYRGANLGVAFHAKLGVATLLLAIVIAINMIGSRAASAGKPPPSWLPKLGMTTPVLTLLAVALAVYVFH